MVICDLTPSIVLALLLLVDAQLHEVLFFLVIAILVVVYLFRFVVRLVLDDEKLRQLGEPVLHSREPAMNFYRTFAVVQQCWLVLRGLLGQFLPWRQLANV